MSILVKIQLYHHETVFNILRHCAGDKPLSEPVMVSLPAHICMARPQWDKVLTTSVYFCGLNQYLSKVVLYNFDIIYYIIKFDIHIWVCLICSVLNYLLYCQIWHSYLGLRHMLSTKLHVSVMVIRKYIWLFANDSFHLKMKITLAQLNFHGRQYLRDIHTN